jgi:hypothetical protein
MFTVTLGDGVDLVSSNNWIFPYHHPWLRPHLLGSAAFPTPIFGMGRHVSTMFNQELCELDVTP